MQSCAEVNSPLEDLEDFVPYAIELASTLKNTVLVDQVPYQYQRKDELMQLLDEHITENIVKVGMRNGLPCSAPNVVPAIDRGSLLPASCRDSPRIGFVLVTVFLFLWRSGTSQV